MLEAIGNHCFKQIKHHGRTILNTRLLMSCDQALRCMHEINTYINRCKKDSEYIASVNLLCDRIEGMKSTKGLESKYGHLVFEGQMEFKCQNAKCYNMCYLMCFQARILIFDIIKHTTRKFSLESIFECQTDVTYFYIESITEKIFN